MNKQISFGVYRGGVFPVAVTNSYLNYGKLIERLNEHFTWLDTPQHFKFSSSILTLAQHSDIENGSYDLTFNDYLYRLCVEFIQSKSDALLVLNDSLYLPEKFEYLVENVINVNDAKTDAVNIWPISGPSVREESPIQDWLVDSKSIERLAFLLTRKGAMKMVRSYDVEFTSNFSKWVERSQLTLRSIVEGRNDRPWVNMRIWQEQRDYAVAIKDDEELRNLVEAGLERTSGRSEAIEQLKVEAFISHWYSTWENITEIEQACREVGYRVTVLNTTNYRKHGWKNDVPISFFKQFELACRCFDISNDYMLFITADCRSSRWQEFFRHANQILKNSSIGTFSPTLTYEHFILGFGGIQYFDYRIPIAVVNINDVIVTFINREVIPKLVEFFDYFQQSRPGYNPKVGHGISELIANLVHDLDLESARDLEFTMLHPRSRSYNSDFAITEREQIFSAIEEFYDRHYNSNFQQNPKFPSEIDSTQEVAIRATYQS
jgi:hypothetical protein